MAHYLLFVCICHFLPKKRKKQAAVGEVMEGHIALSLAKKQHLKYGLDIVLLCR